MTVNQYTQPTNVDFMNTYVPIDFGTLYNITQQQQNLVDRARQEVSENIKQIGSFVSPSQQDVQDYYNLTLGRKDISEEIKKLSTDTDYLKDAANRNRFMNLLNTIDYGSISKLREGAQALSARQQNIADLIKQGRYRQQQDLVDVSRYSTLNQGVLKDLSPTPFQDYKQLSDPFFKALRPSDLGQVSKGGARYNRVGIDEKTLANIAESNFGNLVQTPQGSIYYNELLQSYGGDEQKAKQAFVQNVVGSQQEKLMHQDELDPMWMASFEASLPRQGKEEVKATPATRLDFINKTIYENAFGGIGARTQGWLKEHIPYAKSLIDRYPDSYIGIQAKKDLNKLMSVMNSRSNSQNLANQYAQMYRNTGNQGFMLKAAEEQEKFKYYDNQLMNIAAKPVLEKEFKRASGFYLRDVDNKDKFSQQGYVKGVTSGLDAIKGTILLSDNDKLLTGGQFVKIKDDKGVSKNVYQFPNSSGFILPETAFNLMTETSPRKIERKARMRSSSFPVKDLIEQGMFNDVQFLPDNRNNVLKTGGNLQISGKLRIYKEELNKYISDSSPLEWLYGAASPLFAAPVADYLRTEGNEKAIKRLFGGTKVKEMNTEDGETYYEIPVLKTLPSEDENPEFWQTQLQYWQGSRGIGSSAQAKEAYPVSQQQLME